MRDAAVDRLAKLISDTPSNGPGNENRPQRMNFEIHIGVAEGWSSLFLLAAVVYCTIWSVQAAGWVDHLGVLSITTALGLVIGVVAAKQQRFSPLVVHLVALLFGLLLAFWQTASAFYDGSTILFAQAIQRWVNVAVAGGSSSDDSIFLFLITALGYMLAYTSAWLVYRTRNPWLMIVANAVVLLINLNNVDEIYVIFLIVFLIASLLLLLRFNLYDSMRRWKRQGLRYPDDIGWDVMQAGALISIGILIVSWILPWGYSNALAAQVWNANANPWTQMQQFWNRVISISGGASAANHGNFTDSMALAGNPNLTHDVVLNIKTTDGTQYLMSLNYSTYNGHSWVNGATQSLPLKANISTGSGDLMVRAVLQTINVINAPGEQYPYMLGASEIGSMNEPVNVLMNENGTVIAWLGQNGKLAGGTSYNVTSYVSAADEQTLRTVPLPVDAPQMPPGYTGPFPPTIYDQGIVTANTQLPAGLNKRITNLAREITAGKKTMYDKVLALESYLRSNYTYKVDIHPPSGQDPVSWFLFQSHTGFCNYFSSAMTLMARSLGIPARVAVGYTNGQQDTKNQQWVVRGTDAHSWTQVYFARYGWVNFEPSASFSTFTRPLPSSNQLIPITGPTGPISSPSAGKRGGKNLDNGDLSGNSNASASLTATQIREQVGVAVGSVVLLLIFVGILFILWWQRLFRRYSLVDRVYGRLCVLANWAGVVIRPSQTPYEYIHVLAENAPQDAVTLQRLGDIYVRERWADPESMDHPARSGERNELVGLWKRLQPRLFLHVLRHPYFLRWLPDHLWGFVLALRKRRRTRKFSQDDV